LPGSGSGSGGNGSAGSAFAGAAWPDEAGVEFAALAQRLAGALAVFEDCADRSLR
jgi:hypothetical protein